MLKTSKTVENNSLTKTNKYANRKKRISDVLEIYDGSVRIFKTTNSGDVYQMSMYVKDEKRYVRKSLKTRDKEIAIQIAKKEFIFYEAKLQNGEKLFSLTAEELRDKYLKFIEQQVKEKQISVGRQSNIKTFTKHYLDFVGKNSKIQNIDRKEFQRYRSFRQSEKEDIRMGVVQNESITIKQMYKFAKNEGFISQNYELDFGIFKVDKNESSRVAYEVKDYKQLVSVGMYWFKKVSEIHVKREEEIYYRRTIRDFIVLMGNYGLRTQELLLLKWEDITIHNDETVTIRIRKEISKVKKERKIRGRRSDVFERRKKYSKYTDSDDYVFSRFNKKEVMTKTLLYDYYNALLKEVKKEHKDFEEQDLYSLRHFFITSHLIASKISVYDLAKYCGTSLQQISKTYDNVKMEEISKKLLSYSFKFDKNNNILLDDEINDIEKS
jgi:integrase